MNNRPVASWFLEQVGGKPLSPKPFISKHTAPLPPKKRPAQGQSQDISAKKKSRVNRRTQVDHATQITDRATQTMNHGLQAVPAAYYDSPRIEAVKAGQSIAVNQATQTSSWINEQAVIDATEEATVAFKKYKREINSRYQDAASEYHHHLQRVENERTRLSEAGSREKRARCMAGPVETTSR